MPKILDYIDALRLDNTVSTGIQFIMWPLIFGLILSFFIIYYRRRVIGAFVRAIREAGASDEESAKTLAEIGQEDNSSAISALKKSSSLRRLITICPGVLYWKRSGNPFPRPIWRQRGTALACDSRFCCADSIWHRRFLHSDPPIIQKRDCRKAISFL